MCFAIFNRFFKNLVFWLFKIERKMDEPTYKKIKTIQEEENTDWIELGKIDGAGQVFNISEQIIREDELVRQHLDAFKYALRILITRLDNWGTKQPELKPDFKTIIDLALKFENQSWRCDAIMQRRDDNIEKVLMSLKEVASNEGYTEGRYRALIAFRDYRKEKEKLEKLKIEKELIEKEKLQQEIKGLQQQIEKLEEERKEREQSEMEEIEDENEPIPKSPNRCVSISDDESSLIIDLTTDDIIDSSSPISQSELCPIYEEDEVSEEESIYEEAIEEIMDNESICGKEVEDDTKEKDERKRKESIKSNDTQNITNEKSNILIEENVAEKSIPEPKENDTNDKDMGESTNRAKRRKNNEEKPYDPINLKYAATIEQVKIDGNREFDLNISIASNNIKYILIPETDRAVETLESIRNRLPRITVITMGLIDQDGQSMPASVHLDTLLPCNLVSHNYLSKTTKVQSVERFRIDVGWGNPVEVESNQYAKLTLGGQNGKGRFEGTFVVVKDKRFNYKRIVLGRKFVSTFVRAVEIIETSPYLKGYIYLIRKGETLRHFFAEKTNFRCEFPPKTMFPYKSKQEENK